MRDEAYDVTKNEDKQSAYVDMLEQSVNSDAAIIAYVVGAMGTGTLAGALFALKAENILLCVILAVLGVLGWILSYFVYRKVKKKQIEKMNLLLERQKKKGTKK